MTVAAVSNVSNAVYLGALLIDSLHTLRFLLFNSILPRERDRNRRTWQTLSALLHRLNRPVAMLQCLVLCQYWLPNNPQTLSRMHNLTCRHIVDRSALSLFFLSRLSASLTAQVVHSYWFAAMIYRGLLLGLCTWDTHTHTQTHIFANLSCFCSIFVFFLYTPLLRLKREIWAPISTENV